MPFPLAHPAVIVPLKRRHPSLFHLDALVIGSIVPDTAYVFRNDSLEILSHSFKGVFVYSLPLSLVILLLFRLFIPRLVGFLPVREKLLFQPLCSKPGISMLDIGSLFVGIVSHILWDSFTHLNGQLVKALPQLQYVIASYHWHRISVAIVLWYLSSLFGMIYLAYAYMRWIHDRATNAPPFKKIKTFLIAAAFGFLAQPVELLHHLGNGSKGLLLVVLGTLGMFVVAVFVMGRQFDKTNEPG